MSRVAVVLFNLGGPDSLDAVQPFLFNLFSDPAIIRMPRLIRWLIAWLMARYRAAAARAAYNRIGGRSPLLAGTEAQALALENALAGSGLEIRVFLAMRYWHPFISETAAAVQKWNPDHVILLPLYPQFSNTTTGSAMREWRRIAANLERVTTAVCFWPTEPGWVAALAALTRQGLDTARTVHQSEGQLPRVLFSAHGLPQSMIARGDPYQHHVQQTVAAVVTALREPQLDYQICYQSRVGPQQWIGPDIGDAIRHAGAENIPVVLVPVTFVSEHAETLVELDIEYQHMAKLAGVPAYIRVPTVGTHACFIAGLARLVREALVQTPCRCCLSPIDSCGTSPRVASRQRDLEGI
ncbi:Ferrochelatase, protoheme ferro-lyase [invertebrate metagenome]|uniref:Ferrochelatase, protoheme ferro-lyase n=1 Tax=invertebrate metagenome TaxID=1711999 RepID=A0A484H627_9ZZZZ